MNKDFSDLLITVGVFLAIFLFITAGYKTGYEAGQIDVLSGHQHYHLETNTINTVTWQENK